MRQHGMNIGLKKFTHVIPFLLFRHFQYLGSAHRISIIRILQLRTSSPLSFMLFTVPILSASFFHYYQHRPYISNSHMCSFHALNSFTTYNTIIIVVPKPCVNYGFMNASCWLVNQNWCGIFSCNKFNRKLVYKSRRMYFLASYKQMKQ